MAKRFEEILELMFIKLKKKFLIYESFTTYHGFNIISV